jgi:hypothetical protein
MRFIGPAVLALGIVFFGIVYTYSNPLNLVELWDTGAKIGPIFVCQEACYFKTGLALVGWFLAIILMLIGTIISIESLLPREATPK